MELAGASSLASEIFDFGSNHFSSITRPCRGLACALWISYSVGKLRTITAVVVSLRKYE